MIYGGIYHSIDYLLIYNDILQTSYTQFANYSIGNNEKIDKNEIYYYYLPLSIEKCQPGYVYSHFDKLYPLYLKKYSFI